MILDHYANNDKSQDETITYLVVNYLKVGRRIRFEFIFHSMPSVFLRHVPYFLAYERSFE